MAEEAFHKCLTVQEAAGNSLGQAVALNNLSRLFQKRGTLDAAVEPQEKAIRLLEQVRARYRLGVAKWNLGRLHRRRADLEAAERAMTEAREIFAECGEEAKADAVSAKMASLRKKTSIPWWICALLALPALLILLAVLTAILE